MGDLIRRIWIPVVMVLVAAVGAVTVMRLHAVFGSAPPGFQSTTHGVRGDAIIEFNPKQVLYEVVGSGRNGSPPSTTWMPMPSRNRSMSAPLPWSLAIVDSTLTAVVANVVAQGDSATLGCRIKRSMAWSATSGRWQLRTLRPAAS